VSPFRKNDADVAKDIIKERNEAVHYSELLKEVLTRQGKEITDENMAAAYTSLNLDHELVHVGDGYWNLRGR